MLWILRAMLWILRAMMWILCASIDELDPNPALVSLFALSVIKRCWSEGGLVQLACMCGEQRSYWSGNGQLENDQPRSDCTTGASNIHIGAPNIHVGAPNIRIGAPNIHVGAPNIHIGAPNIHVGAPNINIGAPNIHVGAPNIHWCVGTFRLPSLVESSPLFHTAPKICNQITTTT
eukprot:9502394-Pyramimonas_sp.AAC.1